MDRARHVLHLQGKVCAIIFQKQGEGGSQCLAAAFISQ
jgi:hypothetical protein